MQDGTQAGVTRKVRALEKLRDEGRSKKTGAKIWTVETWLQHWLDNIAAPFVRPNTLAGYEVAVRVHLVPGIGQHRLDRLEPEHVERLYTKMLRAGSAPATVHQAHRTLRAALNEAVRRGHLMRNPTTMARAPRVTSPEIEPYSVDDVQRILKAATERRNGARWAIALALGLRQGECLGPKWTDVDFESGSLTVRRQRNRAKWSHGCGGTCGRKKAGYCPQRLSLRPEVDDTKSKAGLRAIGLPEQLIQLLRAHAAAQDAEREHAGSLWVEGGWVFTDLTGHGVVPRSDYTEWKRLLVDAGVRDGRLHDARHTAATVLLLLGVTERAVMGLMGWSNTAMAARYQHLTAAIRHDVAARIDATLWG